MIYANSINLIRDAQCHTLISPAGQREFQVPEGSGRGFCPACAEPTRIVLVQEFEAFHVCGNPACLECVPAPEIASLLKSVDIIPIIRHGA